MSPAQSIQIALGSIKSSKMRSVLTILGIVIGVAAVIANVSLGASFNQYFTDEIGTIGNNFIIIYSQEPGVFHEHEAELIKNTPGIEGVSPLLQQMAGVTYMSSSRHIDIQGVSEDYEKVANLKLEDGSFLNDKDKYVAVIGHDVAYDKFDRRISNQNSIEIDFRRSDGTVVTRRFKVKGILEEPGTNFVQSGVDADIRIFIPISTMQEILGKDYYDGIFAMSSSIEDLSDTSDEVDKRLARSMGVSTRELDNEDAKPYLIIDQADILEQTDQMAAALTSLLTSVALISLVVGSIGIMNIMLVTVTERTREIGIMKSLGFTNFNVLSMFIVESVIVSFFGGILGTLLGLVGAYGAANAIGMSPVFPVSMIVVGFGISILVGLLAGVYPANKAAKMNPVEALRYE